MSLKKYRHTAILQEFFRKVNKKCFQFTSSSSSVKPDENTPA